MSGKGKRRAPSGEEPPGDERKRKPTKHKKRASSSPPAEKEKLPARQGKSDPSPPPSPRPPRPPHHPAVGAGAAVGAGVATTASSLSRSSPSPRKGGAASGETKRERVFKGKQLSRMVKLKRKQGEVLSVNEMRSLLRQYYTMTLVDGVAHREAINRIHHLDGISTTILEEAVKEWDTNVRIRVRDGASRGGGGGSGGSKKKTASAGSQETPPPRKSPPKGTVVEGGDGGAGGAGGAGGNVPPTV